MPTKTKYLVETSALRPALGSPSAKHNQHFAELVKDGELYGSVYVRMEFIRRWICYFIRAGSVINQCGTVTNGLYHLEQDFGRGPKGALAMIQGILSRAGVLDDTPKIAIEEIASYLTRFIKRFDEVLQKRTANASTCRIGDKTLAIDFNCALADLTRFYTDFNTPIQNCEVNNKLLQLSRRRSRANLLLEDAKTKKLDSVQNLRELKEKKTWVTCTECQTIGDVVIALEQEQDVHLVHIDGAYNQLCPVLGRKNKLVKSLTAADPVVAIPKGVPAEPKD